MLYGPYAWCYYRDEDPDTLGLRWKLDRRDLILLLILVGLTLIPLTIVAMNWPGQSLPRAVGLKKFMRLAIAGIIASVVEETFFRGFLHSLARKRLGKGITIIAISMVFALSHLFLAMHWLRVTTFFPALAMGILREESGSVFPAILYHALGNIWAIWFFPGF